jgi:large subunit ribosomal protein L5
MARLRDKYKNEVVPRMMEVCGYKNIMQVPRMEKIVLNIGMGEAIANAKSLEVAQADLEAIAGQHALITRSRKSIANFKLRLGMPIGLKVTLRGERMWAFYDKLINAVLPRMHEFQGIPADSFDGRGNYTLGMKEQTLFPEIEYDKVDKLRGMEICIVTTATNDQDGKQLLELLGMPFAKDGEG